MEPNNSNNINQPIGTNPVAQPTISPIEQTTPVGVGFQQPAAPLQTPVPMVAATPEMPKKKGGKAIAILIIVLLMTICMAGYLYFAKNQTVNTKKGTTNNSVVAPTSAVAPANNPPPAPQGAVGTETEPSNPEEDLQSIETDINGL